MIDDCSFADNYEDALATLNVMVEYGASEDEITQQILKINTLEKIHETNNNDNDNWRLHTYD